MIWRDRDSSSNVEDRRGSSKGPISGGVGVIVIAIITYFISGGDINKTLEVLFSGSMETTSSKSYTPNQKNDEQSKFISVVLKDTEDVWGAIFSQNAMVYKEPKLVLYTGSTTSSCGGYANASMGPFYCPADQKVYIDLDFFDKLSTSYGAEGDFARAYVLSHEIGHHVQFLLGTIQKVHLKQQRVSKVEANKLLVNLELQADCFSGIWAHHADKMKNILEEGDIDEALNAASSVGDDTLQKKSQGYVVPDSFTHGTSAQRVQWFKRGFDSGNIKMCDTFNYYTSLDSQPKYQNTDNSYNINYTNEYDDRRR